MRDTSPIKGFVLAGGQSSRMGSDKAMTLFRGKPMIAIALETLRCVCAEVAISGNREDLAQFAPVVAERRTGEGPASGIEAALENCSGDWVLMLPVDLPLMSATLLRRWIDVVLRRESILASYMESGGDWHPALCMVHRECLGIFRGMLDAGDRKLTRIFQALGHHLLVVDASTLLPAAERYFANVNTPQELAAAEAAEVPGR